MELGATVCRPRAPRCGDCPVRRGCARRARSRRAAAAPSASRTATASRAGASSPRWSMASRPPDVDERILAGLERDGLIVRGADGPHLP